MGDRPLRAAPAVLAVALALAAAAPAARAEVPEEGVAPPAPLVAVRISTLTGVPDLIGVNVGLAAAHPVLIEAGVGTLVLANTWYVRAGWSFRFREAWRADGGGGTWDALVMGGFRAFYGSGFFAGSDDRGPDLVAGVERVWWPHAALGVDLQVVAGGMWLVDTGRLAPDVRISAGLVF